MPKSFSFYELYQLTFIIIEIKTEKFLNEAYLITHCTIDDITTHHVDSGKFQCILMMRAKKANNILIVS